MKWIKLFDKIGKQPLKTTRNTEVIVFIDGEEFLVTNIRYDSGKLIGLNAIKYMSCKTCEYYGKEVPHTCDICTSLDTEDYYMWKKKSSNV